MASVSRPKALVPSRHCATLPGNTATKKPAATSPTSGRAGDRRGSAPPRAAARRRRTPPPRCLRRRGTNRAPGLGTPGVGSSDGRCRRGAMHHQATSAPRCGPVARSRGHGLVEVVEHAVQHVLSLPHNETIREHHKELNLHVSATAVTIGTKALRTKQDAGGFHEPARRRDPGSQHRTLGGLQPGNPGQEHGPRVAPERRLADTNYAGDSSPRPSRAGRVGRD